MQWLNRKFQCDKRAVYTDTYRVDHGKSFDFSIAVCAFCMGKSLLLYIQLLFVVN